MNFRKGISPVVAIALLIVVSVVAVIGFQNWYGTYSSDMFVKVEKDSSQTSQTNIEVLIGNQLFFKNTLNENISIKQIKIGNKECNISLNLTNGVHNFSLGDCVNNLTLDSNIKDIVVITDKQIYTKKHLFKNISIILPVSTVYGSLNVGYNSNPTNILYNQNQVLINVSSNETIQSCSLNFNGTINNAFTINGSNCWIIQSISNFGSYNYNVTVISMNNGKNQTITKSFSNLESMNWFGDGSDGDILVNTSGIYQNLGSGYTLHPKSVGGQWNSSEDGDMEVVNAKNFIVESGVTFTTTKRCRGLMIYSQGNTIINGTISMTARGAHANPSDNGHVDTPVVPSDGNIVPAEGLVIRRVKSNWTDLLSTPSLISDAHASSIDDFNGTHNSSDLFYGTGNEAVLSEANQRNITDGLVIKIPRVGGAGGLGNSAVPAAWSYSNNGNVLMFGTGGGGAGGAFHVTYAGDGGSGTCFSGGTGGGSSGKTASHEPVQYGGDGSDYGGKGGNADAGGWATCHGGAGNLGGNGAGGYGGYFGLQGNSGTGGFLFITTRFLLGNGNIESKGVSGPNGAAGSHTSVTGGSSGGGIVTVLYSNENNFLGSISALGGPVPSNSANAGGYSSSGGTGSIIGPIKIDS